MRQTPVYIVCSPRPRVGKTLVSRLLTEFLFAEHGRVSAFDINVSDPSLIDFLPRVTERADVIDTRGQMALMDRLIVHDGVPKVIDLGYPSFDAFFRLVAEVGFLKEAERRSVLPVTMFMADHDRASARAFTALRAGFAKAAIIAVDNQFATYGELDEPFASARPLTIPALPGFLKSIIDRKNFSFTQFLRDSNDPSSELHQWTRQNFLAFRELGLNLLLKKMWL